MTYKINNTEITIQPTNGRWVRRQAIGDDGNGRPIYPSVREFQLEWNLVTPAQVNQLQGFFDSLGNTGTAVASLPQYAASTYTFFDYSGCVLREPEFSPFFNEHVTNVLLIVSKIRT